jgi:hypothetical protein
VCTKVPDSDGGVLLRNLRCLMSPPSSSDASPPPCPPPSSTCSSAASSPRPSESPEPKNNNGTESDSGHSSTSECPSMSKCDLEDHSGCPTCPGLYGVIDKIATVLESKCPVPDNTPVERFQCPEKRPDRESDSDGSSDSGEHLRFIDEEGSSLVEIISGVDGGVSDEALLASTSSDDESSSISSVIRAPLAAAEADDSGCEEAAQHKTEEAAAGSIIERQSAVRAQQRDSAAACSDAADASSTMRQKADTADSGKDSAGGATNNNAPPAACTEACNGVASECCWNDDCMDKRRRPAPKSIIKTGHKPPHKRRVTFNENCNKFFDADYVILVGEDANGDETTRLVSMCKKQPNNPHQPDSFPTDLCPFDQNADQVTLSPPEGYKDVLGAVRQDDESGECLCFLLSPALLISAEDVCQEILARRELSVLGADGIISGPRSLFRVLIQQIELQNHARAIYESTYIFS